MAATVSKPTQSAPQAPQSHPESGVNKGGVPLYSTKYFQLCAIGGALACGPTHASVTPIDLVKCNSQTDPEHFGRGAIRGLKSILRGEVRNLGFRVGFPGIWKGVGPTLVGYSFQGAGKYGFYEYFAYHYGQWAGPEFSTKYRAVVWGAASASAEVLADLALCPFEAVKVRVQTNPQYAVGLVDGMKKMVAEEGFGTLYAGLVPLWGRQIPYTVCKFVAFEAIAEKMFSLMPKPKAELHVGEQLGVIFTSGYLAGILCAIVSHPADVLVSKINYLHTRGTFLQKATLIINGTAEKPGTGFSGLWVGLGPRIVMIGTLTGMQWFIYGAFKRAVGLPAPGGH